jgi:type IV secretion system protein VirB9
MSLFQSLCLRVIAAGWALTALAAGTLASPPPAAGVSGAAPEPAAKGVVGVDPRLRTVLYSADEIYRLPGYVGYEIDLQFAPGERFVGLGAGDVDGLSFASEANHLFIKPRAASVRTNLTVLTTLHTYHFDYVLVHAAPDSDRADVIYALRFLYPAAPPVRPATPERPSVAALLARADSERPRNQDYWYCGRPQLRPIAAWDDGVQTHLRFGTRAELPALFVLNDDGSESLVDYHVEHDELVAHRIARRFVLRRGKLVGCIVNRNYLGSGAALPSGTLSGQVERALHGGVTP